MYVYSGWPVSQAKLGVPARLLPMTMEGKNMLTCMQAPPDDGVRALLGGCRRRFREPGGRAGRLAAGAGARRGPVGQGGRLLLPHGGARAAAVAGGRPCSLLYVEAGHGRTAKCSVIMSAASCALRSSCTCHRAHEFCLSTASGGRQVSKMPAMSFCRPAS